MTATIETAVRSDRWRGSGSRRAWRRALGVMPVLLAVVLAARIVPAEELPEAEVKAQLIERFTRFIDWPPSSPAEGDAPFVIGILGDETLRTALGSLAGRTSIKSRRVEVRGLESPADASGCQLVFLSASRKGELAQLLQATRGRPILTVGDGDGFARQGVMIGFYHDGRFLRFEVNDVAARAAGLKLAAELLGVARVVR